jgi:hypothetical protein
MSPGDPMSQELGAEARTCGVTIYFLDENTITVSSNEYCETLCGNGATLNIKKATRVKNRKK